MDIIRSYTLCELFFSQNLCISDNESMRIYLWPFTLYLIFNKITYIFTNGQNCFTYFLEPGQCVSIKNCKIIWKAIIEGPKPLPQRLTEYIRKSRCGDLNQKNICCRSKDIDNVQISEQIAISNRTETFNDNQSIVGHHNLHLLDSRICGKGNHDKISNGNKTSFYEFPWNALLGYRNSLGNIEYNCGGSLITTKFVLTAAHCVTVSPSSNLILVRLGEYDTSLDIDCEINEGSKVCTPPVQDIRIQKIISHSLYDKDNKLNDIALLKLRKDADISVRPICLPVTKEMLDNKPQKFIVTGWGKTENRTKSKTLLKANVFSYPRDICETTLKQLSKRIVLTKAHFCAIGEENVDTCSGDSGGPIQVLSNFNNELRLVQYGIVSFGPSSCGHGQTYPGVYTDLRHFLQWILNNLSL